MSELILLWAMQIQAPTVREAFVEAERLCRYGGGDYVSFGKFGKFWVEAKCYKKVAK